MLSGECNLNYGAIFENFVAQELTAHGYDLYYYNSKKFGELDFVVEHSGHILPIEVKSGKDYTKHNALNNVLSNPEFCLSESIVLCNDNVRLDGIVTYLPIYMSMFIKRKDQTSPLIYKPDLSGLM